LRLIRTQSMAEYLTLDSRRGFLELGLILSNNAFSGF